MKRMSVLAVMVMAVAFLVGGCGQKVDEQPKKPAEAPMTTPPPPPPPASSPAPGSPMTPAPAPGTTPSAPAPGGK